MIEKMLLLLLSLELAQKLGQYPLAADMLMFVAFRAAKAAVTELLVELVQQVELVVLQERLAQLHHGMEVVLALEALQDLQAQLEQLERLALEEKYHLNKILK